jgi:hypothetical protein
VIDLDRTEVWMSRPDLQAGFNGWQAIDPTPPPQFWQNNSGGSIHNTANNCSVVSFLCIIHQIKRIEDHGLLNLSVGAHLPSSLFVVAKLDSLTIPPT